MAVKSYRIKIVKNGIEIEAEGDKAFVVGIIDKFMPQTLSEASIKLLGHSSDKSFLKKSVAMAQGIAIGKGISIREFVQQFEIKKHTDITLAFGYYLEKHAGQENFSTNDINKCYYDAKIEGSNTSQMIIHNIKRGYMMEAKKKGDKGISRFTLTNSGEIFVATKMPRNS